MLSTELSSFKITPPLNMVLLRLVQNKFLLFLKECRDSQKSKLRGSTNSSKGIFCPHFITEPSIFNLNSEYAQIHNQLVCPPSMSKSQTKLIFFLPQPKELNGSTLGDLINWLMEWTSRPEMEARHKAMEFIFRLTSNDNLKSTFLGYVGARHGNDVDKFLEFVESCNFPGKQGVRKFPEPVILTKSSGFFWHL